MGTLAQMNLRLRIWRVKRERLGASPAFVCIAPIARGEKLWHRQRS